MLITRELFIFCILVVVLNSCANNSHSSNKPSLTPPLGMVPKIRSSAGSESRQNPLPNQLSVDEIPHSEEDLVFTDPDNPDAEIPQFETTQPKVSNEIWINSDTQARQMAVKEGRPILVWFTDTARSPLCKILEAELFADYQFGNWAKSHLIRLKVDSNVTVSDDNLSLGEKSNLETLRREYVKKLKKRYGVLGHPNLLLISTNGEILCRHRGYKKGDKDYVWGLLKQGVAANEISHSAWMKQMEQKGYRFWTGTNQAKIFAKLMSFSGLEIILVEPNGTRIKTNVSHISKNDKHWLTQYWNKQ